MTRSPLLLPDPISATYIAWCTAERVPENTIRRRRAVLRSVGNAGTATREEVEAWWLSRSHHNGRPRADSSRANDLAVLRSFYKWAQLWEHRDDDPTRRLSPPRAGDGAPRPFTSSELTRIRDHVADDPVLRRAIALGAGAGLRISEAAALDWPDVDAETRQARVVGKGRKTRIVSFAPRLIAELLPDTGGNVVTGTTALGAGTLGRRVNAAIRAAVGHGSFHKLRHTYGSRAYQRTLDPQAVAKQLGHSSTDTTMRYYAAAADDAGRAIAEAVTEDW